MLSKKIYNYYRNQRSNYILSLNRIIYGDKFKIKKGVYVRKGFVVTIEEDGYVTIGSGVFFNNYCSINSLCGIEIGDDCIFGENVHIYDHNHIYSDPNMPVNSQGFTKSLVRIGRNCWIGSNVVVLKGVTIGEHSIIGANSVIYDDVPAYSVVICNQDLKLKMFNLQE
jgi:acetyltransferase-like isoleucine patch superfamily enzyme